MVENSVKDVSPCGKGVKVEEKKNEPVPVFKVTHCAYPKCYGDAKIVVSGTPFCRKHSEMADFFLWIAGQIRVKDSNITKSGLILPK
jgi:hypothetical protein